MKNIWITIVIVSTILLCFNNPNGCIEALINAGSEGVNLLIYLLGIYSIWLGILNIVQECGLTEKIASLFEPLVDWLFGKTDQKTQGYLSMNIATNMLGIGNASTPLGLKAMSNLDNKNNNIIASPAMIMLIVLNATSMQLIPTTIISLRQQFGSISSTDIILPTIISTIITTGLGIVMVKLFSKRAVKHAY